MLLPTCHHEQSLPDTDGRFLNLLLLLAVAPSTVKLPEGTNLATEVELSFHANRLSSGLNVEDETDLGFA